MGLSITRPKSAHQDNPAKATVMARGQKKGEGKLRDLGFFRIKRIEELIAWYREDLSGGHTAAR